MIKKVLTADQRKARNKRKRTVYKIISSNEKPVNRKKNRHLRRRRANTGEFIPFVMKRPRWIKNPLTGKRTIFDGYIGFNSKKKYRIELNNILLERAMKARKVGYYSF